MLDRLASIVGLLLEPCGTDCTPESDRRISREWDRSLDKCHEWDRDPKGAFDPGKVRWKRAPAPVPKPVWPVATRPDDRLRLVDFPIGEYVTPSGEYVEISPSIALRPDAGPQLWTKVTSGAQQLLLEAVVRLDREMADIGDNVCIALCDSAERYLSKIGRSSQVAFVIRILWLSSSDVSLFRALERIAVSQWRGGNVAELVAQKSKGVSALEDFLQFVRERPEPIREFWWTRRDASHQVVPVCARFVDGALELIGLSWDGKDEGVSVASAEELRVELCSEVGASGGEPHEHRPGLEDATPARRRPLMDRVRRSVPIQHSVESWVAQQFIGSSSDRVGGSLRRPWAREEGPGFTTRVWKGP